MGGKSRKGGTPSLSLIRRIKRGKCTSKKKEKIKGVKISFGLVEKNEVHEDSGEE